MLHLIILAGGKGERAGGPKGLIDFGGRPWILRQLERAQRAGITSTIVVLGHEAAQYTAKIPLLAHALTTETHHEGMRIRAVISERPELGPFTSIQAAVGALDEEDWAASRGAYVLPVDVPCPDTEIFADLRACLVSGNGRVQAAVPEFEGRGGHPVALASAFLKKLSAIDPRGSEARLDAQIRRLGSQAALRVIVEDEAVSLNLNTRDDFDKRRMPSTAMN